MYMHVYINLEEYSKVVFILTEVLQSLFFFFLIAAIFLI